MKNTPSPKNLEGFRPAFFLFGLILSLFIVLVVMEYRMDAPMATANLVDEGSNPLDPYSPPVTIRTPLPPPPANTPDIPDEVFNPNLDKIDIVMNNAIDASLFSMDSLQSIEPIELLGTPDIVVHAMNLDRMAIYAGCEVIEGEKDRRDCFMQKISQTVIDNLEISELDRRFGVSGRMTVEFVIGMDGKVRDVTVFRAPTASIETQVSEIVSNLPEFLPGMKDGKVRSSRMVLPIRLQLN